MNAETVTREQVEDFMFLANAYSFRIVEELRWKVLESGDEGGGFKSAVEGHESMS